MFTEQKTLSSLTLGDFVRHVAAKITESNEGFPYNKEEPWHTMLIEMRNKYQNKLEFLKSIKFEVGEVPYPRCKKLSEFLQALHWSGALTVENPTYANACVIPSLVKEWIQEENELDEVYRDIIEDAVQEFITPAK